MACKSKRYDVWYVVRVPNSRKDCVHCHRKSSVMFVYVQLHIIINGRGGMLGLMLEIVMNELRKLRMSDDFFANSSHIISRCPGV